MAYLFAGIVISGFLYIVIGIGSDCIFMGIDWLTPYVNVTSALTSYTPPLPLDGGLNLPFKMLSWLPVISPPPSPTDQLTRLNLTLFGSLLVILILTSIGSPPTIAMSLLSSIPFIIGFSYTVIFLISV